MPRVSARRILVLAVALGVLVDVLVPRNAAGLNAPLVTVACLAAAGAVAGREGLRRFDPADAWMPPAAVLLAAMAVVRADAWLVQADVLFAAALAAGTIAALAGARITRGLVPRVIDAAGAVLATTVAGALVVLAGARSPGRAPAGDPGAEGEAPAASLGSRMRARLAPLVPVARGLVIAAPLVIVFALLFASADAVFDRLARATLDLRLIVDIDPADVVERTVVVACVAWAAAGLLALAGGHVASLLAPPAVGRASPPRSLGAASAADLAPQRRGFGPVEAATILAAVDALFAAFVVLQLTYLFGGRDTLAVAGLTYADYARRGFFELVAVAILAGTLVACLDVAVGRRSRVQLAGGLALLGLTAIVLASAFVRLRLYQDAYGWTELRFVVVVAIGWLASALVATAWLVVRRRARWTLHVLGIMVVVTVLGMNAVGPQAFVADRNLERAIDPSLVPPGGRTGLDAEYLASLGDEAIPAVVAALDGLQPPQRARLEQFLERRAAELASDPSLLGWPAFNVGRERARAALGTWQSAR